MEIHEPLMKMHEHLMEIHELLMEIHGLSWRFMNLSWRCLKHSWRSMNHSWIFMKHPRIRTTDSIFIIKSFKCFQNCPVEPTDSSLFLSKGIGNLNPFIKQSFRLTSIFCWTQILCLILGKATKDLFVCDNLFT